MRQQQKFLYSAGVALIVFFLSMASSFIPCKVSPNVPNPEPVWKLCSLNPDLVATEYSSRLFFGYTSSLMKTYVLLLCVVFVLAFLALHLLTRRRDLRN